MINIGIIISIHNRLKYTKRCLHCLNDASKKYLVDLIIIDDGSSDGSFSWIKRNYPEAYLIKGDGNLWFGRSTQMGINYALSKNRYDYILILNNDTFMLEGSIDKMVEKSNHANVIGTLYEVEDLNEIRSCGFNWSIINGLRDITLDKSWNKVTNSYNFIEVYAVSTTATLFPIKYLVDTFEIPIDLHPHHRYDAILSSVCKRGGAKFFVPNQIFAKHVIGQSLNNKTNKNISKFLFDLFFNPLSTSYLPGIFNFAINVAPNNLFAFIYFFKMNLYFLLKLIKVFSYKMKLIK